MRRQRGFVAVEVLVGLTVTAFVLTGAITLTSRLFRSERLAVDRAADKDAVWRTHNVIRQSLDGVILLHGANGTQPSISGSKQSFEVWTKGPAALAAQEPMIIRFEVETSGAFSSLVMTWHGGSGGNKGVDVIMGGARTIALAYRARSPGATWSDVWRAPEAPDLIRLTIETATLRPTVLYLPVRASIPPECVAAPTIPACQT
jgi:hypothetical protein